MAYQKPMVQVYQEYAATSGSSSTASLPACIIGPCYHIIDADDDEALAYAGEYTVDGVFDKTFPNNISGALIDEDSIVFRLANAYVDIIPEISIVSGGVAFSGNMITGLTDAKRLAVGDYVYFTPLAENNVYTYRVMDVDNDANTILINRNIPAGVTKMTIRRLFQDIHYKKGASGFGEVTHTATGKEVIGGGYNGTIDANSEKYGLFLLTTEIDGVACPIASASLYVGYTAMRQDLCKLTTINTVDEIEGKLGKVIPENPLAYGVMITLSNTTTSVFAMGVDSDDLVGYTSAKDKLETIDPLYSMVPLTTSTEVLTMFKNSAEQMSDPEIDMWRIAIGSSTLQSEETITSGYGKCSTDSNGKNLLFTVTRGITSPATGIEDPVELKTSGVAAGDVLILTDANGDSFKYNIALVASEDILTVEPVNPFMESLVQGNPELSFTIMRTLDKTAQAKNIAAVSTSYNSSRFIHVWPDVCVIDDRELPGYYLCCAIAGGISSLPSQYGFTNLSMSGIGGIKHSNSYFSQEQLNIIAGGGTFIFVQNSDESAPYVRHQLTTDISTTEFSELSFVKNYDYVSYVCRDVLQPFIGTWNVNSAALAAISTALSAALETLKLASQAKIGAPVINYDIESVSQLESNRTRVEAYVNITFPYPLNVIGLHLVSQ